MANVPMNIIRSGEIANEPANETATEIACTIRANRRNTMQKLSLRALVLVTWAVFAVILTTQTDRVPVVRLMVVTIGSTAIGDALGHAGLFGTLAFVCYAALVIRLPQRRALPLAMLLALAAGTATECYQLGVAGRSSSLSDLLANWLGIFIVGFAVLFMSKESFKGHEIY
jgi:VanZ family protein